MTGLPDPLVPHDVDLRDFAFMPVDIVRLFGSQFHANTTDAEWRAGVTLWLKSYHQVPAASIPDDDVALARLAELGRDHKSWKKIKTGALRGWRLCSDGRLYHPVVAEKAMEGWNAKRFHHWKRECDRLRKENKNREEKRQSPMTMPGRPADFVLNADGTRYEIPRKDAGFPTESLSASSGFPEENALKGQGQGQVLDTPLRSVSYSEPNGSDAGGPSAAAEVVPIDARTRLFRDGLTTLRRITGKPENASRNLLGKWLKAADDDASIVMAAINRAEDNRPAEPVAWIEKAIQPRPDQRRLYDPSI